jgi:hypothetical protein
MNIKSSEGENVVDIKSVIQIKINSRSENYHIPIRNINTFSFQECN